LTVGIFFAAQDAPVLFQSAHQRLNPDQCDIMHQYNAISGMASLLRLEQIPRKKFWSMEIFLFRFRDCHKILQVTVSAGLQY
jgi:hypothetical protein